MRKLRVVMCLILSVVLSIGVIPTTVSAATAINEEALINFTAPAAGKAAAESLTATVPGGAHYHILEAAWFCDNDNRFMYSDEVFQRNKTYWFAAVLEADNGYEFSVYSTVTVNGGSSLINRDYTGVTEDGYFQLVTVSMSPSYSGSYDPLTYVNVKVYEAPASGLKVSDLHAPSVDGDAPYTISQWHWHNADEQYGMESDDVFEEGVRYYIVIMIAPKNGYKFASSVTFLINGESSVVNQSASSVRSDSLVEISSKPMLPENGAFRVKKVTVNGYEKPVVGQKLNTMPGFSVPSGAPYTLVSANWFNSSASAMRPTDTFEAGKSYYVRCVIQINSGYSFTSSIEMDIDADIDYGKSSMSGGYVYVYTKPVTPYTGLIKNISVTMPEPEIGMTVSGLAAPAVASGLHYTIDSYAWTRELTYNAREQLQSSYIFRGGEKYSCNIMIRPENGYAFSNFCTVSINNSADLVDASASKEKSSGLFAVWSVSKTLEGDEEGLITDVNVDGFKVPKAGQTVLQNLLGVQLSASEKYTVTAVGWVDGSTPLSADDAFEEGSTYYLVCRLTPADGYYFDSTRLPTVCLNGSGQYVDSPYTRVNSNGELIFYSIEFTAEAGADEIITEVSLTGFTAPTVGETTGENISRLTLPAGAAYTVKAGWIASYSTTMGANDMFEEGVTYYLALAFTPKAGYCFDENNLPAVYINGSAEYVDARYTSLVDGVLRVSLTDFNAVSEPAIKYGDVNDDDKINGQDLIRLRKHLNGESVQIGPGANVNGDAAGVINGQDLIRLRKYLNGENVVLGPSN